MTTLNPGEFTSLPHDPHSSHDRRLVRAALVYAVLAFVGAIAAITAGLPTEFLGHTPTTTPLRDFLWPQGLGTALSPPVSGLLVTLALSAALHGRVGPLGLWRGLLVLLSLALTVGAFGEPYTYVALGDLRGGNHLHQLVIVGQLFGAMSLLYAAVRAALSR